MTRWIAGGLITLALAAPVVGRADDGQADGPLTRTIGALDRALFDAYNRCQLATFAALFAADVEFYHDTGGATFDRETVVANTKKYICGKVRRELVSGSLHVYPIKDFGAIEEGEHRFCPLSGGVCEGAAKFLIVWREQAGQWQATRVLSYGHRAL